MRLLSTFDIPEKKSCTRCGCEATDCGLDACCNNVEFETRGYWLLPENRKAEEEEEGGGEE